MDGASPAGESFIYRIDAENRVSFVTTDWLAFARDNEAQHLSSEAVQGEPLFSFISDPETQHLYETIIHKVRTAQASAIIPFRCDSPRLRRFMVLHISPLPDDGVQFEGKLIREEAREPVALLDADIGRSDKILVSCSWCKRIEVDGSWMEVEDAVRRLDLFDQIPLPQISHGICSDCFGHFNQAFGLEPRG